MSEEYAETILTISVSVAILPYSKLFDYGHTSESQFSATCNTTTAERVLPANATNWILRNSNGNAVLLDERSTLHAIVDPGVYVCLAQRYYVLDQTTDAELDQFLGLPVNLPAACP